MGRQSMMGCTFKTLRREIRRTPPREPGGRLNAPTGLARLALAILMSHLLVPPAPAGEEQHPPLVLNLHRTGQVFRGFGVQVWAGDLSVAPVLRDLRIAYVRIGLEPFPKTPPDVSGWTDVDYDRFAASHIPHGWLKSWGLLAQRHIQIIANMFQVPDQWKTGAPKHRSLDPRYHVAFAKFAAAGLKQLRDAGVLVQALEAFNEPDGDWNCFVPPAGYNAMLKVLRLELDRHGLQDLMLVGPGRAHIDTAGQERWIEALDADAVRSLGAWSIHGYLWDAAHAGEPDFARVSYERGFGPAVAAKDPDHAKPVYITEFAPLAAFKLVKNAIEQPPFAALAVRHALAFYNCGAGVVSYWEAADMAWAPKDHNGLLRPDKTPRPVYFALKTVFAHWPPGARVVQVPTQPVDEVYAAAVFDERSQTLALSLVNCTARPLAKTVQLVGGSGLVLNSAEAFEEGKVVEKQLVLESGDTLHVRLPPASVLTCVLSTSGRSPR